MTTETKDQTQVDAEAQAKAQYEGIVEMVEALESARVDDSSTVDVATDAVDIARDALLENALSVEVRSAWAIPGVTLEPYEFQILLSWGGPACRIMGELDENNEPRRAWLEYQGWGTPWMQYFGASQETLLAYAREFCYSA